MKNIRKTLIYPALTGAMYAALTMVLAPISYGGVQLRISEVLTLLPFFLPETAIGLFVGCALANTISTAGLLDIVFGSLATLLAALWTQHTRRKWLAPLPPVVCNAVIVGAIVTVQQVPAELFWGTFAYNALTIGLGEALACYLLGGLLLTQLPKSRLFQ